MNILILIEFFKWCTIINGSLLIFWSIVIIAAPNLVYKTQAKFFPIPRENFDVVMYSFLGLFKVFVIIFNVVPFVALLIIQ